MLHNWPETKAPDVSAAPVPRPGDVAQADNVDEDSKSSDAEDSDPGSDADHSTETENSDDNPDSDFPFPVSSSSQTHKFLRLKHHALPPINLR